MRLFSSHRHVEVPEPDLIVPLVWRYEVSDDDGESWRLEDDVDVLASDCLRRGNWFAPPLN